LLQPRYPLRQLWPWTGGPAGEPGAPRPSVARRAAAWRPVWSRAAARRALRATLVMPSLFALTYKGFGNLQMALFASFGSFATLVLVTFAGTWRDKLIAHLGLAIAGSALLAIGTVIRSSTAVAALVTVPVTFLVFFAGVTGPNAAAGVTGALLAFVLPAASPGTAAMIPDRLAGWWLASVVGTCAVLALPAPAAGTRLRGAVANLTDALANQVDALLRGESSRALEEAALEAKRELLNRFSATPFRPTGLALRDQALANAVELLEWCTALVTDLVTELSDLRGAPAVERELLETAAEVLRQAGALFAGADARPDLERLEAARRHSLGRIRRLTPGSEGFEAQARLAFHANTLALAVLALGADALMAARLATPDWVAAARRRWFDDDELAASGRLAAVSRYSRAAARQASPRSVWLINSARGALALAAAVAVADLTSVQHGFWVVLGTLSVLRTNASATGATAVRALLGAAIGFVIGSALLLAIGSSSKVLWVTLPIAVLVAAYSPGTAPFAVGQAAFTVTVVVLFNLLVPAGWKVGELRIEDVALGCLVSVIVGALFWPRGVASTVGDDLAQAFRAGASYLREAVGWVCGPDSEVPRSGRPALTAGLRLDEAVRGFLAEQGSKRIAKEDLWRLIGGTLRLRLTAHAIAELPRECAQTDPADREALAERVENLYQWYDALAGQVQRSQNNSTPSVPRAPLDSPDVHATSRQAVWLSAHLDHLSAHLPALIEPAARVSELRRRPWWR
jgi:uncharacterized membrane protein YccC